MPRYDTEYAKARTYHDEWKGIEITDRPTDKFGVYEHTKKDVYVNQQKGTASAYAISVTKCEQGASIRQAEYWIKLGHLATGSQCGRCFSCAAVAVYTLVKDAAFDGLQIDVVGAPGFDHHFIVLSDGPVSAGDPSDTGADTYWDDDAVVVDIWQGNLGGTNPVCRWRGFQYNTDTNKIFCSLRPEDRGTHRGIATLLGETGKLIESEYTEEQLSGVYEKAYAVEITKKVETKWVSKTTLSKVFKLSCLDCVKGESSVGVMCTTCFGKGCLWLTIEEVKDAYGERDRLLNTFILNELVKVYLWRCENCAKTYPKANVKKCTGCGEQLLPD